jgi:hypothetical protein
MIFTHNRSTRDLSVAIHRTLIFFDEQNLGAQYIQAHLEELFLVEGRAWTTRRIPHNRHLVEPPDQQWREIAIQRGDIWLRGVCFIMEAYNWAQHGGGHAPIPFWIQMRGLSFSLWRPSEFKHIANEMRDNILMDVDSRSEKHLDLDVLCMQVGVFERNIISSHIKLKFIDDDHRIYFHTLSIDIEGATSFVQAPPIIPPPPPPPPPEDPWENASKRNW